jgi:hypothetical protein|tara:strand:+ start:354 stop:536 length:183 start_codon:yes stop_codon:yes gene_type:complete
MSKEFVDALVNSNNIEAEKAFSITMAARVGDALEVKRRELANTFVKSSYVDNESDVNETD